MHTIRHTIVRHGSFYYNRRVPERAREAFGAMVRVRLSDNHEEALHLSERLTETLNSIWSGERIESGVDLPALVEASRPQSCTVAELSEGYLSLKKLNPVPVRAAVRALIAVAGDKDIEDYNRRDARAVVTYLQSQGNSTGTIRRRLGSLSAIMNYGYAEFEIERRNPFSRLMIEGEGEDVQKRGTFTLGQLREGYREAFQSGSEVKLLMPILGETGCRLAEVVGLRLEDIDLEREAIRIIPHAARRLKTKGSEREIPLVGAALEATKLLMKRREAGFLYPRYLKDGTIRATHASNALNKWLKRDFDGLTAHCLRHTFRDRLRAVECPMEIIDQLGGWASVKSVGRGYGKGYSLDQLRKWLTEATQTLAANHFLSL